MWLTGVFVLSKLAVGEKAVGQATKMWKYDCEVDVPDSRACFLRRGPFIYARVSQLPCSGVILRPHLL